MFHREILFFFSYGGDWIFNSGNVGIGTPSPSSKLTVAGNITPSANNTYSLGTPDLVWKDVYVGNDSLYIGGKKLSNAGGDLFWDGSPVGSGGSFNCPAGFTKVESQGYILGCMMNNEVGTANWPTANDLCFDTYGGRIPNYDEWFIAMSNYALNDETDDYEWMGNPVGIDSGLSRWDVMLIAGSGGLSQLSASFDDGSNAYRCFIPSSSVSSTPTGSLMQFAGSSAPSGWLIADGSAISRTTYSGLFAVIGTTYGVGDGSTTFNLPDLRGNVPVGKDSGTFSTLGATGGEETHTLSVGEMPQHRHSPNSDTNFVTANSGGSYAYNSGTGSSSFQGRSVTDYEGGDQAHNNLQPYIVVNYIIKT